MVQNINLDVIVAINNMTEKQEYIIKRLNDIIDIALELMNIAVTGEDGNLYEMSYHIRCYSNKIISHLSKEWRNNIKFTTRKEEKRKLKAEQKKREDKEVQQLNRQIFEKFMK